MRVSLRDRTELSVVSAMGMGTCLMLRGLLSGPAQDGVTGSPSFLSISVPRGWELPLSFCTSQWLSRPLLFKLPSWKPCIDKELVRSVDFRFFPPLECQYLHCTKSPGLPGSTFKLEGWAGNFAGSGIMEGVVSRWEAESYCHLSRLGFLLLC